jgi:guanosine-3',5'-bis(diphosphate) 3'-pyrophosphohydrolase
MTIAFAAMQFAKRVHDGQSRKYTGGPYASHLAEVAGIVATVAEDASSFQAATRDEMIAVAWLHDCVEDQGVDPQELMNDFGYNVASGVKWLSDMDKEGTREERKAKSRARLEQAPAWVQTIKCADLISNTSTIAKLDPEFAAGYLTEKRRLLIALTKADPRLWALAFKIANAPVELLATV